MGKAMKFWGSSCFVAGTDVLAGSGGETVCKKIEDVKVGDLVWTRPENDADAPLELRPVTAVYQNVVYELRRVTIEDAAGNTEELGVTTEHPFYSVTRGWVRAADLVVGEEITSADGRVMHVTANLVEAHPEGIVTYNFQVEEGHTYFVADGLGEESWIWVHNDCTSKAARILGKDLDAAKYIRNPGDQAAHLVPTGNFSKRTARVKEAIKFCQDKFNDVMGASMRNRAVNGFFAQSGHLGTHTDAFFLKMAKMMKNANTETKMVAVLDKLKKMALQKKFLKGKI